MFPRFFYWSVCFSFYIRSLIHQGLPCGSDSTWVWVCLQCRGSGFNPWVGKIPWRREWQSTPVFWPGKSHGWRSLAGYSPCGHKESDTTEQLTHTFPSNFTVSQNITQKYLRQSVPSLQKSSIKKYEIHDACNSIFYWYFFFLIWHTNWSRKPQNEENE